MKINQLKIGVLLSYVSMFLSTSISIVYTPLMLNLLGQNEYGLYQLVASVTSYLSLLTLGFGGAYIRFYSRYKVNNDEQSIAKLNGMFLTIFSVIGVVALLCGGVLVANIENVFSESLTGSEIEIARVLMIILVINVALSMPASVFNSYITANEMYFYQKVLGLIRILLNPFLMISVLLLGYGSVGMVVVSTTLNIVTELIYVVYAFKKINMKVDFHGFDFSLLKEIAIFSSYLFINIIVDQVNWNVDKFLLGMYMGTKAVAIYAIAAQLNTYYISFSTSISSVFVPKVNKIVVETDDNTILTELFTKVGRIQFFVLALVLTGLIFFGKPFITIWAGEEYSEAYYMIIILASTSIVSLTQNIGIEIQRAKNKHQFRSWLYLGIAVINVFISIPLCKLYGGIGCAIGTGLAVITGNVILMNIYYHRKIGLNMFFYWRNIIRMMLGMIMPITVGIFISKFIYLYNPISLIIFIAIYTFVYIISMWMIGLNLYEKDLIKKPVKQILNKVHVIRI